MSAPSATGFYVAFEGSYEDPQRRGALAGPYPTLKYARDWAALLKDVRRWGLQRDPKRPLYIIRVKLKPRAGVAS